MKTFQKKSDELFGPYRIPIIISAYGSKEHNDKLNEISDWCLEHCQSMSSYPGERAGEVVFCFQDENDATLFALRWS